VEVVYYGNCVGSDATRRARFASVFGSDADPIVYCFMETLLATEVRKLCCCGFFRNASSSALAEPRRCGRMSESLQQRPEHAGVN